MLPAFYLLGMVVYQVYYVAFERRDDQSLRGLSFFFGVLFITEVDAGADLRRRLPLRCRRPISGPACTSACSTCRCACWCPSWSRMVMVVGLQIFLSRTFVGRAIQAVAQDQRALRLMAANPTKIKRIAFGLSIATAALAGACLIIIQPVEPSIGREYIGRIFAICVLGGLGSLPGMVIAAMTLGIAESLTATFFGPSWAPAVAFGILLITLAVRPSGILGR